MKAKEFIALLRTSKPFLAWVTVTADDGYYMKQMKSEWIKYLKEDKHNQFEYDVTETDGKIYLN